MQKSPGPQFRLVCYPRSHVSRPGAPPHRLAVKRTASAQIGGTFVMSVSSVCVKFIFLVAVTLYADATAFHPCR